MIGFPAVVLLSSAGCSVVDQVVPAPADALEPLISAKFDLVRRYDATVRRHPALASRLTSLRTDQVGHLERLLALLHPERRAAAGGSAPATVPPSGGGAPAASNAPRSTDTSADPGADPSAGTGPAGQVPSSPTAAVALLGATQRALADLSRADCLSAVAERAALLGSISACDASHLVVLR
jgi:hypothetical protein